MAASRTFLLVLGFAFLAYFAVEAHRWRRVNPIMECVIVHPDGSVTACFGYENFEEDDFDIDFGDDNDFEVCSRRDWRQIRRVIRPRRIPNRPGRTPFYPNCTFTVTFPRDCDCRWRLFGKLARATRTSQRCPTQDTTKPWFDKCPGTLPAVSTDSKKATKTLDVIASAQDNNPGVTITNTLTTATGGTLRYAFPLGTTTFNFVATDSAGNTATCPVVVPVIDTEPPVATAPAPYSCKTDPGKNYATIGANIVKASATDNDPRTITISNSGNTGAQPGADARGQYPIGATTMTFVAKDFSQNPSSPVQTIVTVRDEEVPSITCPATATGTLPALSNQAQVSITLTGVSDNSGTPTVKFATSTSTGTVAPPYNHVASYGLGQTVVQFTATDAYSNSKSCSTTVTVTDAIAPVIACDANIVHGTDEGLNTYSATVGASATDNSGVNPTFDSPGASVTRAFPLGDTVVPFTARDGSNNAASCSVTITVTDQESPVVTCPAPLTVSTIVGGNVANIELFAARAVDNVAVTSLAQDCDTSAQATLNADGSADLNTATSAACTFPIGTKSVTWTARDAANNVGTCVGTVTVRDTEAPVFPPDSCAPVSVVTEAGKPDAAVTTSVAATDNSQGTITYTYQVGSGASQSGSAVSQRFPSGLTNVIFTATDASGNSASCTVVVTVQDNQPPQLELREPPAVPGSNSLTIIKPVLPGQTSANVDLTVFASDNVGVAQAGIVGITEGVELAQGFIWYTAIVPSGQTISYVFYAVDGSVQRTELTVSITAVPGDPCAPNPCQNGATCTADGLTAVCTCAAGFTGPLCETQLTCGVKQPFTVSACPLDVPVEVKMTCTSGVTWTFTWSALSGPAGYDISPLNTWLATQTGNTVLCRKNLMTPEGDYVFRVTGTSGATSFTAETTAHKQNGATPSISISGVPEDQIVSRNHPLPLTAVLDFPPESCLRSEPYKSTWEQIYPSRTFIDMVPCNGNPADSPEVLAASTRVCTIPAWSFELSKWTGMSFEYPSWVNWDPDWWYTFKVCASPVNDIAAHSVCATTQVREVRGQKITAMITGWRVMHGELGVIGIPVTSNQLPYDMDPSPYLWIYPGGQPRRPDPTVVSLNLFSDTDNFITTEPNFQAFGDPENMPPRPGTVDWNQPPNDPKLIFEWDCVSAYSWSRCFAGWLPPKCCELQAGINRLGFINRVDQPKLLVPKETVAVFNQNFYPNDPDDWSFYAIRVKIYPENHPELGDQTLIVARPNNDGPQGNDILPIYCGLEPTVTYQMSIIGSDEYIGPEQITVEQAFLWCLARWNNESVPIGPWDPLSAPSSGMQLQADPTSGVTIKWHEMDDKLDLSKWDNTLGLSLDPSVLTAGTEYKLCYTQTTVATGATAQGCTRYQYDPKPPACTGTTCLFVSPSTGTALKDKFTISVNGFKTQHPTPLRYVFKYIAAGTKFEVPLSDLQLHSSTSAVLPAGEITLVVYAYDEKKLFTRQTLKVTVNKPEGSAKCAALDTVKTLLADAERTADAMTAVDLITAITSYFRAAPGALTCNGVDQTQTISEARTRFLRLLDLYSQAASKSSSRANQWASALSGVSAMYRSGAVMSAEERRTALAVVDRILTGMNTLTTLTDSILAGTNVMSIVSDLAGSGDCQLAEDLKSRITQIHRLILKNNVPNAQWANKQPNVEAHVQRVQTNSAWNIKPKTSKPINVFIPASALKPTEAFVDVAVITFTAPALRNCRAAAPKSSGSYWHSEAVEKTGLQGSLVSNPVEVEIFSSVKGTRMQLEGLDEPIRITMVSDSSCGNSASVCGSWADSTWTGAGCSVAHSDDSSVTCACTHLAEVGVISTGESCSSFNAGYAVVFAAYGVGAVVAAVVMGGFYVRKSSHLSTKIAMFGVIAVVAICRLISGLYFAGAGGSQGLTDVVLAIPFGLYFFVNTQLFERVRQASSPTALPASKLTGLFKLYYGFFTLGLGALIVAAFYTGSTHNVIAMSTTRVLAGASMLAALLFGVNGVLARPVGSSPDVSLFRTYLLSSFCVLVGSLIWVALATDALTAGLLLPVDLIWGLAIANLYRRDGEVKSAAPKAASGEPAPAAV